VVAIHIVKEITMALLEGHMKTLTLAALFGVCVCLETIREESFRILPLGHRSRILTHALLPNGLMLIARGDFRIDHNLPRCCHLAMRRMMVVTPAAAAAAACGVATANACCCRGGCY